MSLLDFAEEAETELLKLKKQNISYKLNEDNDMLKVEKRLVKSNKTAS